MRSSRDIGGCQETNGLRSPFGLIEYRLEHIGPIGEYDGRSWSTLRVQNVQGGIGAQVHTLASIWFTASQSDVRLNMSMS